MLAPAHTFIRTGALWVLTPVYPAYRTCQVVCVRGHNMLIHDIHNPQTLQRPNTPSCTRQAAVAHLLLYPPNVGRIDSTPRRHVFFHALRYARPLAARKRAAGLGDAPLEALDVEVL